MPQEDWFRNESVKRTLLDIVDSGSLERRPYFNAASCREGVRSFLRGGEYRGFWRWMNAEIWLQQYFDGSLAVAAA